MKYIFLHSIQRTGLAYSYRRCILEITNGKIEMRVDAKVRKGIICMVKHLCFRNNVRVDIKEDRRFEYSNFCIVLEGGEEACMKVSEYFVSLTKNPQVKIGKIA